MKRVLFIHDLLDFRAGGAVLVVLNLLETMDPTQYELELATPRAREKVKDSGNDAFAKLGIPLHTLPPLTQTSDRSIMQTIATAIQLLMLQLSVVSLLLRRKPDFLYVHSVTSLHFATLPALLTRTRLVYHEHGLNAVRSQSVWGLAFPWLIKRATHVICIAKTIEEEVIAGGVAACRVSTVANGLATSEVKPSLPSENRDPDATFAVVQIANLLPWKGHATVIRAAELAHRKIPGLQISFYGNAPFADLEAELRALQRECRVEDVVEFCGYSEGLEARLPEFDCLVVASDSEPFGLVLLEGMRAGVPVLGTRAGGVPEIVRHEHNGLLFEPGDYESLAQHFIRLASDRSFARSLAQQGLVTLAERFSLEAQARGVEAVLTALAQGSERQFESTP